MTDAPPPKSAFIAVRNAFITGVVLLAPLVVTLWALGGVIDFVGGSFRPLFERWLPRSLREYPLLWDIAATIVIFGLVTALGFLSHYVFGRVLLRVLERSVQGIPGVGAIYNSVRQIVTTFGTQNKNLFNKVVLVEYPRQGVWTLGFLTNKQQGEPQSRVGPETWTVFVPTTPNPTSGFLLMLPRTEIVELDMSVGDGMKMILSGGAVVPPHPTPPPAA